MSTAPPPPDDPHDDLAVPSWSLPRTEREAREKAATADIDARLAAGTLSAEDADEEALELALERFGFLPEDAIDELRRVGRMLNEQPEMVEGHSLAPRPRDKDC